MRAIRNLLIGGEEQSDDREADIDMEPGELCCLLDDELRRDILHKLDMHGPMRPDRLEALMGVDIGEVGGRLLMLETYGIMHIGADGYIHIGPQFRPVVSMLNELERRCAE